MPDSQLSSKKTYFILFVVIITVLLVIFGLIVVVLQEKDNEANDDLSGNAVDNTENVDTSDTDSIKQVPYSVVDTGQVVCSDDEDVMTCASEGAGFYGQDANYEYVPFSYKDNGDGTVSDNNTGLMWQQSADLDEDGTINVNDKYYQEGAEKYCETLSLAGYDDWRLPNIKTLYSLMNFAGRDVVTSTDLNAKPFISTEYFDFGYGDTEADERQVDSQWATTSIYVSTVMNNQKAMFGLNLADGRIKGYPTDKLFYVKCVRGGDSYSENSFVDNGDQTITDQATGLTWQQGDSENTANWEEALRGCQDLELGGYDDWRLPNAKELHSLVDYSRSPDTTDSPAIDNVFNSTSFTNEMGEKDWGFYWTSTTHIQSDNGASDGVYISFGRALGYMQTRWMDVHGAGAQRSDPKIPLDIGQIPTDPQNQFQIIDGAIAHGPQGDVVRGANYYRCVRGSSGTYNGETPVKSDSSTEFDFSGVSLDSQSQQSQQPQQSQASDTQSPPEGEVNSPPQEAIAACDGKSENSECSFQAPDKQIAGTCRTIGTTLACAP